MGTAMIKPVIARCESWLSLAKGMVNSSTIDPLAKVKLSAAVLNSNVSAFTYVGINSILQTTEVGRYSSIAPNVVCGGVQHETRFACTSRFVFDLAPLQATTIQADVWIGASAQIISGVCLGIGSIVGAGSVVTKNTEPFGIYVGNPARLKRLRYPPDVIEELLASHYWLMEPVKCRAYLENFFLSA